MGWVVMARGVPASRCPEGRAGARVGGVPPPMAAARVRHRTAGGLPTDMGDTRGALPHPPRPSHLLRVCTVRAIVPFPPFPPSLPPVVPPSLPLPFFSHCASSLPSVCSGWPTPRTHPRLHSSPPTHVAPTRRLGRSTMGGRGSCPSAAATAAPTPPRWQRFWASRRRREVRRRAGGRRATAGGGQTRS
ncbi:hypothetical protein I4F81_011191 [Pyropia yezoensis]|uniref:Uncharacterized protein n=1 Tax=Pyropia yezoensis TaxID=2788 RepID=A0ACC3CFS7_PYRYE|nr:hypothetical protein I4F81_011191 [Neopyropia yezoensis]